MKIALVLNDSFSMWHFFRGLVEGLVKESHEVFLLTPNGPGVAELEQLGATHLIVPVRRSIDPLGDLRFCLRLARTFRTRRIDLVCNMTIKPIVYGSIAARIARVPQVVGIVEGVGYAFMETEGIGAKATNLAAKLFYRVGCWLSDRIGFANPDDLAQFVREGYLPSRKAVSFRSMVGVDTHANSAHRVDPTIVQSLRQVLKLSPDRPVVAMISRVVWSKGVREFVAASEIAATWNPTPVFLLVGPREPDARDCVPEHYLRGKTSARFMWINQFTRDLKAILTLADIVVLPSYYREGLPRILLEAMAFGKPLVTTNHGGCRETVEEGRNGFLVPVKDAERFARAVQILVEQPEMRDRFGRYSRTKAESEFEEAKVVLEVMRRLFGLSVGQNGAASEVGVASNLAARGGAL